MTANESINLTYDMFKHYQENGYDERTAVSLAVKDIMLIMDRESRVAGRN